MKVNFSPVTQKYNPSVNFAKKDTASNSAGENNIIPSYSDMLIFTGTREEFKKELIKLPDVHCPKCGTLMLNDDKYNQLTEIARKISTPSEFISFIKNNSEYINPNDFKLIIVNFESILENNPEITLSELFRESYTRANEKVTADVLNIKNYIQNLSLNDDITLNDEAVIDECAKKLSELSKDKTVSSSKFNSIITAFINSLEVENKDEIYNKCKNYINDGIKLRNFSFYNAHLAKTEPAQYQVISRIFTHSRNHLVRILKPNPQMDIDKYGSIMLMCSDCSNDEIINFINDVKAQKNINHLKQYLYDVSEALLTGKMPYEYNKYPAEVNNITKKITNNEVVIRGGAFGKLKDRYFQENMTAFPLRDLEGNTCPSCGTPLLTHEEKSKLFDRLANAETTEELIRITEENQRFLHKEYRFILRIFAQDYGNDRSIKSDVIIKDINDAAKKRISASLLYAAEQIEKILANKKLSLRDCGLINDFLSEIRLNPIYHYYKKDFPIDEYKELTQNTIMQMDYSQKGKIKDIAQRAYRSNWYHLFIKAPRLDDTRAKLPLGIILQNVFRSSTANVSYLVPKENGGIDEAENLILLCKKCRKDKENTSLSYWYNTNFQQKKYLSEYLANADRIIKVNNVAELYNYPQQIADTFNREFETGISVKEYTPEKPSFLIRSRNNLEQFFNFLLNPAGLTIEKEDSGRVMHMHEKN